MAYTDREDLNYLGQLFLIGQNKTPLLNMMGGLTGGGKTTKSFNFPVAQPWSLNAAGQNATSEALAAVAGTPETYARAQVYNTCQIMKYDYASTFAKQSTYGEMSGLSIQGVQPVTDEFAFQKAAALKQMAVDIEFSMFKGAYVAQNTSATVAKTRGLGAAITTNEVVAAGAKLTKDMIDELLLEMAGNGSEFNNMVIFANAFNIDVLNDIYSYAPEDRNIGGTNLKTIITPFAEFGLSYEPQIATDDIYFVDMSVMYPVFCPYNGQVIADIDTAVVAAAKGGFLYTQFGLDYGPETFHGKISGTATA